MTTLNPESNYYFVYQVQYMNSYWQMPVRREQNFNAIISLYIYTLKKTIKSSSTQ